MMLLRYCVSDLFVRSSKGRVMNTIELTSCSLLSPCTECFVRDYGEEFLQDICVKSKSESKSFKISSFFLNFLSIGWILRVLHPFLV